MAARQAAHDAEVARKEKEAAASDPVDVADVAAAQREAQDLIDSSAAKVAEEGEKNTMAAANAESAKAAAAGTSAVLDIFWQYFVSSTYQYLYSLLFFL